MKRLILSGSIILFLAGMPLQAQTIIFWDQFDRGTPSSHFPLGGHATTEAANGYLVWAAAGWETDGSGALIADERSKSAFVRFQPEAGHVYELSADLTIENPMQYENSWLGIAFSQTANPNLQLFTPAIGSNGFFLRDNNAVQAVFEGSGTLLKDRGENTVKLVLTLDTRDSEWTLGWTVDDVDYGSRTFVSNPEINFVGFGNFTTAKGRVQNLMLKLID